MPQRSQDSRSALVAAARQVLAERGLAGMTFDRIAKRAGCAKGLVNYHFPSRVVLLAELVSRLGEELWSARLVGLSPAGIGAVDGTWKVLLTEQTSSIHLAIDGLAAMRTEEQVDRAFKVTNQSSMARWAAGTAGWLERSGFRTDSQADVANATAALLDGFAVRLSTDDPADLYPAYLTAWLGLIAALSASPG